MSADVQYYYSNNATEELFQNTSHLFLKEVYDVMKKCYGPYGSHIMLGTSGTAEPTKDGKMILSKIKTNSSIANIVHNSIFSVADKQVEEVGDGSTTTILLLCSLYEKFNKILKDTNISTSIFNEKIKKCIDNIIKELNNIKINIVDDSGNIDFDLLHSSIYTSVDANADLANKILEMFKELNTIDPYVLMELSDTESHRYELVNGLEVEGTILRSDVFFNGFSHQEYNSPQVVMINGRLDIRSEFFIELADKYIREDKDLIFLCTGMDDSLLETIITIHNTNPTQFNRVAVFQMLRTATDDMFMDMCASIGASYIESDTLKKAINMNQVLSIINKSAGTCVKAQLTEFAARFHEPKSDEEKVTERLSEIETKISMLKNDPSAYNDRIADLELRKALLSKSYATFFVGGTSPQRKNINYELANDAILQSISCMKHGIVNGCNVTVPFIVDKCLKDMNPDVYDPVERMIYTSIFDSYLELYAELIDNKINNYDESLNEAKERYNDAICESDITKIVSGLNIRDNDREFVVNSADTDRAILQNATDMAALLVTTKGIITNSIEFDVVRKGYKIN